MDTLLGNVLWHNCGMSATYDVDGAKHSSPSRHDLVVNNVKPSDKMLMEGEQIEAREVRKSCDYCVMRKRKCDGNGTRICSFCEKRGLMCIYGKKRMNRRHSSSAGKGCGDQGMFSHTRESVKRTNDKWVFKPGRPDGVKESAAETGIQTCGRKMENWAGRCRVEPRSERPIVEPDNLGCDSILGVGSTVIGGENNGFMEAFAVGSSLDEPNTARVPIVPSGGLDNPFGQIGADGLLREDWDIAIDALL